MAGLWASRVFTGCAPAPCGPCIRAGALAAVGLLRPDRALPLIAAFGPLAGAIVPARTRCWSSATAVAPAAAVLVGLSAWGRSARRTGVAGGR